MQNYGRRACSSSPWQSIQPDPHFFEGFLVVVVVCIYAIGRRWTWAVQVGEELLVERARQGEVEAFGILVEQYQDKLYNFVLRIVGHRDDAADIAQEAFVRAYQELPRLRESGAFTTWLFRIAANLARTAYRNRQRMPTVDLDAVAPIEQINGHYDTVGFVDAEESVEAVVEKQEKRRRMALAVGALPPRYKEPVLLRYVAELSYEQIGEVLQLPCRTVETRIYRAKQMLRRSCESLRSW